MYCTRNKQHISMVQCLATQKVERAMAKSNCGECKPGIIVYANRAKVGGGKIDMMPKSKGLMMGNRFSARGKQYIVDRVLPQGQYLVSEV